MAMVTAAAVADLQSVLAMDTAGLAIAMSVARTGTGHIGLCMQLPVIKVIIAEAMAVEAMAAVITVDTAADMWVDTEVDVAAAGEDLLSAGSRQSYAQSIVGRFAGEGAGQ